MGLELQLLALLLPFQSSVKDLIRFIGSEIYFFTFSSIFRILVKKSPTYIWNQHYFLLVSIVHLGLLCLYHLKPHHDNFVRFLSSKQWFYFSRFYTYDASQVSFCDQFTFVYICCFKIILVNSIWVHSNVSYQSDNRTGHFSFIFYIEDSFETRKSRKCC
jgi:hypothetical protein